MAANASAFDPFCGESSSCFFQHFFVRGLVHHRSESICIVLYANMRRKKHDNSTLLAKSLSLSQTELSRRALARLLALHSTLEQAPGPRRDAPSGHAATAAYIRAGRGPCTSARVHPHALTEPSPVRASLLPSVSLALASTPTPTNTLASTPTRPPPRAVRPLPPARPSLRTGRRGIPTPSALNRSGYGSTGPRRCRGRGTS